MKNKFLRIGLASAPENAGNMDRTGGNEFCFNCDYEMGTGSGNGYEDNNGSYKSWISFEAPEINCNGKDIGSWQGKGDGDCTGGEDPFGVMEIYIKEGEKLFSRVN